MKCARFLLIAAIALLLPALAAAKDKDEGGLQLTTAVQLGTTQLQPGDYKVVWTNNGSDVKVTFLQHDKVLATTTGQVIELKHPSPYDDVVLKPVGNSQAKTIDEIDFSNRTEALRIEPPMTAKTAAVDNR